MFRECNKKFPETNWDSAEAAAAPKSALESPSRVSFVIGLLQYGATGVVYGILYKILETHPRLVTSVFLMLGGTWLDEISRLSLTGMADLTSALVLEYVSRPHVKVVSSASIGLP
jgi:hypothetical protein